MDNQVRCINIKTGAVKWLPQHLSKNVQLMKSYDLIVQDLEVEKEELKIEKVATEIIETNSIEIPKSKKQKKAKTETKPTE